MLGRPVPLIRSTPSRFPKPARAKSNRGSPGRATRTSVGAVSPTCSVPFVRPLELSTQFNRARASDEWATTATPKVKVNLVSSAIGTPGLAISGTASFDLITGENTSVAIVAPVTLRLSEVVRINVNGGWLWDRTVDRQYLTYGIGVDWRTPDNVWTLTAEVFWPDRRDRGDRQCHATEIPNWPALAADRSMECRRHLRPQHSGRKRALGYACDDHPLPADGQVNTFHSLTAARPTPR